jgi:hypothetical protein
MAEGILAVMAANWHCDLDSLAQAASLMLAHLESRPARRQRHGARRRRYWRAVLAAIHREQAEVRQLLDLLAAAATGGSA